MSGQRLSTTHTHVSSDVGLGNVPNLKQTLSAVGEPSASDDSTSGYAVGSRWVIPAENRQFFCFDASAGAAVWVETAAVASVFCAYDQTGGVNIDSGFTSVPWLTEVYKDANVFTHAANSSIVTINYSGLLLVTANVGVHNNSAGTSVAIRTTSAFRLVLDPATGTFAEVTGSRVNVYARNGISDGSGSITRILQVEPNYRLQVQGMRLNGGGVMTTAANLSRLTLLTIKPT